MRLASALIGSLDEYMAAEIAFGKKAVSNGVWETAEEGKSRLRAQVMAGFGSKRLANSWRANDYPRQGYSLGAASDVFTNAEDIMGLAERTGILRSKHGFWLAIPGPALPNRGGRYGTHYTPSDFPETRFGKLRFVYRRGKASLLVVEGVRLGRAGRVSRQLANEGRTSTGRWRKSASSAIMFYLVPFVRLKKRMNIEGEFRRMEERLVPNIMRHWDGQ